jgi:DnaD/phage-associated family protein
VPDLFFARYLPRLGHADDIKVFLHVHWRIHRRPRGTVPAVRHADLVSDPTLARSLTPGAGTAATARTGWPSIAGLGERGPGAADAPTARDGPEALNAALDRLVAAGLLLAAEIGDGRARARWIFRNDPSGRRARDRAVAEGLPIEVPAGVAPAGHSDGASIFTLYEENIGPLTPLLAEELAEAEATYSPRRIEAAFKAAVEANVRRWSYVRAILERMTTEKDDGTSRYAGVSAREKYLGGDNAGYVDG